MPPVWVSNNVKGGCVEIDQVDMQASVIRSIQEDVGTGDVTASLIDELSVVTATVICRDQAVICGQAWFSEVFRQVDQDVNIEWLCQEGDKVDAGTLLCNIQGRARSILTAERAALNFLQMLSATATATAAYVEKVSHTQAKILDTRKTLPGLRLAQKYAVCCGGGQNHRKGLYDMVLIKENHIMAAGSITAAVKLSRQLHPDIKVEVETENLGELEQAIAAKSDVIMLDNFNLDDMVKAVAINKGTGILLEASGGVNLSTVEAIAETGVDLIYVGEITKNIQSVDLSFCLS